MGEIRIPLPVKLFVGILSPELHLFSECIDILSAAYGPIDLESEIMPWEITEYYRDEMGTGISRKFVFFRELIDPSELSKAKLFTNDIENRFSVTAPSGLKRRVNLDPGYVTEAKVVLASTKDFSHRLYIGERIYAEVTLKYSNKDRSFFSLDHTYFDFRTDTYKDLFNRARDMLRKQLNR